MAACAAMRKSVLSLANLRDNVGVRAFAFKGHSGALLRRSERTDGVKTCCLPEHAGEMRCLVYCTAAFLCLV
jgi:hypothetical protein